MIFIPTMIGSAIAFAAIAVVSTSAAAQGTTSQRSHCMGDALRFCRSVVPNVAKIEACLRENEKLLTPECRAEFHPQTQRTKLESDHFKQ